jgi:nucleotide-binding universal stress UspA family protein
VLAVCDGSIGTQPAVAVATTLAAVSGGELYLLMVQTLPLFPTTLGEVDAEKRLIDRRFAFLTASAYRRAQEAQVCLHADLVVGHPYERVLEYVADKRIDLLVVGALRSSAVSTFLFGGLTERLARAAPCAVHLVK